MALIPLSEYAKRRGIDRSSVYGAYRRGKFASAVKPGRDILIDEHEPYTDRRTKAERRKVGRSR